METDIKTTIALLGSRSDGFFRADMETLRMGLAIDLNKKGQRLQKILFQLEIKENNRAELLVKMDHFKAMQTELPSDRSMDEVMQAINRLEIAIASATCSIEDLRYTAATVQAKYEMIKVQLDLVTYILTIPAKTP